jgi:hypothetical protein
MDVAETQGRKFIFAVGVPLKIRHGIGIDISPTACRVMAKRLRDVCGLPESEPLW